MEKSLIKLFSFLFCILLVLNLFGCSKEINNNSSTNSISQNLDTNNSEDDTVNANIDFSTINETSENEESGINTDRLSINEVFESEESLNTNIEDDTSYLDSNNSSENLDSSTNNDALIDIAETDPNYYDVLRPWYNIGHNKQLRGTPIIYAIFMDDEESSWDVVLIEKFLNDEIDPAITYLETEAKKWGIGLDLSIKSFATVLNQGYTFKYEGVVNRDLRQSPSTKDVLEKVAIDFGYSSEETLHEAISLLNGGKEIIFLCIFNKDGTCYTRNQATNGSTTLIEETILFRRPLNCPEFFLKKGQRVSVVAHEILHLFGAEDFYLTTSRENLAEQYYPNDIMLWQYSDVNENTLGDCVAYSIGWTNITPEVCYNKEWWE